MTAPVESSIQTVCKHWLNAATTLLAYQWKLFEVQYEVGLKIVEVALGGAADRDPDARNRETTPPADLVGLPGEHNASSESTTASEVEKLKRLAAERISQGLAPPREIYQAPYRSQIDWARFPEWARPSDPELFEGSGHEG